MNSLLSFHDIYNLGLYRTPLFVCSGAEVLLFIELTYLFITCAIFFLGFFIGFKSIFSRSFFLKVLWFCSNYAFSVELYFRFCNCTCPSHCSIVHFHLQSVMLKRRFRFFYEFVVFHFPFFDRMMNIFLPWSTFFVVELCDVVSVPFVNYWCEYIDIILVTFSPIFLIIPSTGWR